MVLVGGEPGSGKSRLVRELAALATAGGARRGRGRLRRGRSGRPTSRSPRRSARCSARCPTPSWRPSSAAGRSSSRASSPTSPRRPQPPRRSRAIPTPTGTARTSPSKTCSRAATETRPLVLVVEDCHWADVATLHLLRHLARPGDGRLLVVATFRDTEADVPTELAETLADLRRSESVVRLRLAGLSTPEIDELVCRLADTRRRAQPELVAAIAELTAGNPFLITELWRALQDGGAIAHDGDGLRLVRPLADIATPEGVREVVAQRIARVARRHARPARPGRDDRPGVRPGRRARRRRVGARQPADRGRRGSLERPDRGGRRARVLLPLRARARPPRRLRPPLRPPSRRSPPAGGRGAGAPAARTGRPSSPTTSRRPCR